MPLNYDKRDDPTLLHGGARFNDKIPCNCGLSYCNGWAFRRTRSRHLAKVEELRKAQATVEGTMENVEPNAPLGCDQPGVPFEPPDIDSHGNPYEDEKQDEVEMEDSDTEAENIVNEPNPADTWSLIDTPPASRPETPVLVHDEDLLDDGEYDGFVHVDHEDIEIYERWFTEDCEEELRELQREMISDEDLTNIKMMSIRLCGHISRGNYDRIRHAFRKQLQLYTLFTLQKRIAALCGISTVFYDRCRNNCLAFTGGFSNDYRCRSCLKPRYKADGKPAAQYEIIPLNGRLRALFLDRSMAKSMRYRHLYAQHDGLIEDIFDSELYKSLCEQFVTIDGRNAGHRYFEGERDIAFSLLGDGVQLFEQGHISTNSCWPIVFQNLNLPPSERCKLNNILPLTIIPGPNQPKDFNSFFHPFVEELIELAGSGISAYDEYKKERFTLRGYPLIVCGDMQAIKHFGGMKGPNAKSPCRMCRIVGVYDPIRKTNYIPLVQPFDHQNPPAMLDSYDPHNLPLRTTAGIQQQEAEIKAAPTKTKQNELATHYGLSHPTILDRIPSLRRPDSYPHEFMHLFLLNHGPNLVDLWVGKFKGISGPGSAGYMIPPKVWAEIGQETFAASRTIPSAFTRVLPNIATDRRFYNAESWAFWLQYIGPVVLRGRLLDKYYEHYMDLVWIIKALLQLSITTEQLDELEQRTISYVERFEEYYYQYDFERLSVCKLTLHALLHVPSDVRRCGPVWTSWSFLIERYCAVAVEAAGSKVNPYKSIANRVLEMAQLAALALQHKSVKRALRMGIEGTPGDVSSMEHTYKQYPLTILRFPCLREYAPDDSQRRRLAGYFCEQLDAQGTFNEWFSLLPTYCTRYGKVRVRNGGDYIRSAIAGNPLSSLDHRDASFVRYVYWRDKHENYPRRAPEMVKTTEYGRLECILVLKLEPNVTLGIQEEQVRILADITPCVCVGEDATLELVSYRKFQPKRIFDIQAVECVVGDVSLAVPGANWGGITFAHAVDRNDRLLYDTARCYSPPEYLSSKIHLIDREFSHSLGMSDTTNPKYRSIILLAVLFVVIRTLSSCVSQIIRDIIFSHPTSEPKDYCRQVEPFDASNWTAAYDVDGFDAKAAELLGGAVRIPTVSVEGTGSVGDGESWIVFDKLHKYLEEQFPRVHQLLSLEKVNTYGLLYVWQGSDSTLKPMVLMGHQDVVPVDPQTVNQWKQPPFSGYYDGTWIWGRGSGDDKSGLIGILATIESLLERGFKPTRTLILSFGYDEEIGGPRGAQFLAERIFNIYGEDGIALIVDEGDTAGSVVTDKGVPIARPAVGEKGSITVSIEVKTPGGHSSVPPAHTSIGVLSRIVVDLEDHPYEVELRRTNPMYALLQCEAAYAASDAMLPRLRQAIKRSLVSDGALELVNDIMSSDRVWRAFVGTTQAVDIIHGGVKSNALPEQATAIVNHRIAIESSYVDVQDHLGAMLAEWGGAFNLSVEAFGKEVSKGKAPFYGAINVTSVSNGHNAAPLSPTDSEAKPWKVLSGSIRGAYRGSKNKFSEDDIIVSPSLMTGNTDTRYYWKLSKHIFRYNHHFAIDLYNGAHTSNEAYKASGLVEMIKFFTTLIINADQSEAL